MRKITVDLSDAGLRRLIDELDRTQKDLKRKAQELVDRLAAEGAEIAQWHFDMAYYVGDNGIVKVDVEPRGDCVSAVVATGDAVLFIEFGAGYLMGYGHPEPLGYGPGTYPGKGHWDDPNGWWLPKDVQETTGQTKSYGNPPAMAMYNAHKELEQRIQQIAQEVFAD